jgi:ankyrin repeat protein
MLTKKVNNMILIDYVKLGNINEINRLISLDVDLNDQDEYGYTPLIWAASYSNPTIAKILLDAGADKTIQDYEGRDALYWANYYGCQEAVDLLTDPPVTVETVALRRTRKTAQPLTPTIEVQ